MDFYYSQGPQGTDKDNILAYKSDSVVKSRLKKKNLAFAMPTAERKKSTVEKQRGKKKDPFPLPVNYGIPSAECRRDSPVENPGVKKSN